ncbi:MAG: 4-(cytidine 5'-diphospho)-2-C-methyl-D-erythritol kinase [Thermodesulfobacteriota bacterium]
MNNRRIVQSPAKINLLLRVLRKRDDGYHDILSVIHPVGLYDEISIEVGSGEAISVGCDSPEVPVDRTNLAYIATELFLKTTGLKSSVSIQITKNIPVGAGLGGGSSDAAAVLLGLNELLKAGVTRKRLMEIGAELGSDVPLFMLEGPVVATGRGELLRRVELPSYQYILVNPGFSVSTAWAYANLDLTKRGEDNTLIYSEEPFRDEESFADVDKLSEFLANDLEAVTASNYPEISRVKRMLIELGACGALMSGSGPTVFGVFKSRVAAMRAFDTLKGSMDERFSIFIAEGL